MIQRLTIICLSLFLTACGGDGGGGNGKRGVSVTPDLSGAKEVSVGGSHACAVLATGKLACWGLNLAGQLGDDTTENRSSPVKVALEEGRTAVTVGTGLGHTCAIFDDDSLKCWGENANGQLGFPGAHPRRIPTNVDMGNNVPKAISLGGSHSCAILDDDSLKCWGKNDAGQLGVGDTTYRNTPSAVNLGEGKTATAIGAGYNYTCAVLNDGSVKCWGDNQNGQLGDGTTTDHNTPPTGTVDLGSNRTAVGIGLGNYHTCAILNDNSLVCWGRNEEGQLGVDASNNETCTVRSVNQDCVKTPTVVDLGTDRTAVAVAAGRYHTCALLDDNSVKCWGGNDLGQLGDESITNRNAPVSVDLGDKTVAAIQAREHATCALFEDGSVTCWGNNERGQLGTGESGNSILSPQTVEAGGEGWTFTAITGGFNHSCALRENADSSAYMWCWGANDRGQLGLGDKVNRLSLAVIPTTSSFDSISAGSNHTCAVQNVADTKKLTCWGQNDVGQLGIGSTTDQNTTQTVNLGNNKTPKAVSAGSIHTCAILNDNKIKCWGGGGSGRLGNGASTNQTSPVAVTMTSNTAVKISLGRKHTCAIFDDNKVYCWGENNAGQLGIGSNTDQNTPSVVDLGMDGDSNAYTATAISAGHDHTCAILNDKSVKCWGYNNTGQVGDRSTTSRTSPVAVPLGSGRTATAIHAKRSHTCAILDDASLLCWGWNDYGQLGDGTTTRRKTPVAVDLGEGRTAIKVGGGNFYTCAILDDDSLKCWGYNQNGQTALPTSHRGDQPGEMGENLVFVDLDIDKEEEEEEEVGPGVVLALGLDHACAINEDGMLKCWGDNGSGELGVARTSNVTCSDADGNSRGCIKAPMMVELGTDRTAIQINLGDAYTCAILDDDSLKCWGINLNGVLGIGGSPPLLSEDPLEVELETGRTPRALSVGATHSCAVLDNGTLVCWGENSSGQLGDGTSNVRSIPTEITLGDGRTATSVSAGVLHTCAILDNGALNCWGENRQGGLGINSTTNQNSPTGVTLPDNKTALAVGTGSRHTCAILSDDSLVCWGRNENGQLGVGTSSNEVCSISGTDYDCIKTPVEVNLGTDRSAKEISLGTEHTCALLDNGSVKCWGQNTFGKLGDGSTTNRNTPVAVTLPTGRSAQSIHVKANNSCAVLDDNSIWCWGANHFGQLLDGTTIDRYAPVRARL